MQPLFLTYIAHRFKNTLPGKNCKIWRCYFHKYHFSTWISCGIESQDQTTTSVSVVLCVCDDSNAEMHFDMWPLSKLGSLQATSGLSSEPPHLCWTILFLFWKFPRELLGNTLEEWGHCIASLEDNPGEELDDAGLNSKALEVVKYATSFAPFYHSQMELRSCTHGRTIEKLALFW